jgi:hypothetical protein
MALVHCEVSEGLRQSEATVKLLTYDGRPEFLPVDRGFLSEEGGKHYLSVGLVHISHEKKAALVSLPVEADSWAHRLWVKLDHLKQVPSIPEGRYAGQYAIQGPD